MIGFKYKPIGYSDRLIFLKHHFSPVRSLMLYLYKTVRWEKMVNEKTYIMLKPDAVKRHLIGEIVSRIEKKGYQITQAKLMTLDKKVIAEHYAHLLHKPFYPNLEAYMTSGPVFGMVVEGENVIAGMRQLMGPTNVYEALPGTIRGDYANNTTENIIHGSDCKEAATIEIKRFFG